MILPAKKRRRPVKETTLPELCEILEVIAKLDKRMRRLELEFATRRPIGFHTDCEAHKEIPDPIDDENEAI